MGRELVDAVAHQTAAARRISQRLERCDAVPLRTRERGVSSWVVNTSVRLIGLDGDGSSKKALIPRCLSATAI